MAGKVVNYAGALVFGAIFFFATNLPWPARVVTGFLIGPLVAIAIMQARLIAQLPQTEWPSRMKMYASTIVGLWALAFATAVAASESGFQPELIGVITPAVTPFWLWLAFSLCGAGALIAVFQAFAVGESQIVQQLIPQTRREQIVFVGVSITAGICEELVFRGFLITALRVATGSLLVAVLVSAAVFGIVHAHQKATGALRAGLLGLVLTVPLITTGSLYPGIAAHIIVDIAAGLWLARWLIRS